MAFNRDNPAITPALESLCRSLLRLIGEDPERDGLRDTPARFARWWREFIDYDGGTTDTVFESVESSDLIVVSGIRVWSLCEHHLLPFSCVIAMGYVPADRVLGLSKFARIAHEQAHRLQLQERLVDDIANRIEAVTGSSSVAVIGFGEHLCMTMRGIKAPGRMTTSAMRGAFYEKPEARAEFLELVKMAQHASRSGE